MSLLRTLAACAAFSLAVAAPALAQSTHADVAGTVPAGHVTFSTALTPAYYGAGAYVGVLNLDISPNGIITGYYRNEDVGTSQQVSGGLNGNQIWLDLGFDGPHIVGTYEDGKIVGETPLVGRQPFLFTATPEAKQL